MRVDIAYDLQKKNKSCKVIIIKSKEDLLKILYQTIKFLVRL